MNDRIKLAEAMGYTKTKHNRWKSPCGKRVDSYPPNPFTDANDDYAVLEWMRNHEHPEYFVEELRGIHLLSKWHYFVGDYARAALKVIE